MVVVDDGGGEHGLVVLEAVPLVHDEVVPPDLAQERLVAHHQVVVRQQHVELVARYLDARISRVRVRQKGRMRDYDTAGNALSCTIWTGRVSSVLNLWPPRERWGFEPIRHSVGHDLRKPVCTEARCGSSSGCLDVSDFRHTGRLCRDFEVSIIISYFGILKPLQDA